MSGSTTSLGPRPSNRRCNLSEAAVRGSGTETKVVQCDPRTRQGGCLVLADCRSAGGSETGSFCTTASSVVQNNDAVV